MMDAEAIKVFGQVAGIGGLAVGVFLYVARDIIRKEIFPTLTKKQSSRIILMLAFMAWTTALAGIASWTYISVQSRPKTNGNTHPVFPANKDEERTVREVLAFLEIKLTLLNELYGSFYKTWNEAEEYTKEESLSKYVTLVSYVRFQQKEMKNLLELNHPLSQSLRKNVQRTPISAENLAVMYDCVNIDSRELSERLAFLLVLLDANMPFDNANRERWLTTTREAHRQSVLNLTYAICEFLLPISRNALQEFRTEVIPKLTWFESDAFNFALDETQLKQLQNATDRKRSALGDQLARIVGGMNVQAQVLKDRVQEMRKKLQNMDEDNHH